LLYSNTKWGRSKPNQIIIHIQIVATRRPLAVNSWSEESKHNLDIPVETEFFNLLQATAGEQTLLSYHYPC
jgi:hypothetical protein